jgi:hypothetical protein
MGKIVFRDTHCCIVSFPFSSLKSIDYCTFLCQSFHGLCLCVSMGPNIKHRRNEVLPKEAVKAGSLESSAHRATRKQGERVYSEAKGKTEAT